MKHESLIGKTLRFSNKYVWFDFVVDQEDELLVSGKCAVSGINVYSVKISECRVLDVADVDIMQSSIDRFTHELNMLRVKNEQLLDNIAYNNSRIKNIVDHIAKLNGKNS